MSHYCYSEYQHIIPISINENIVEYIKYNSSHKDNSYPCWCEIDKDHNRIQYMLHGKTNWPSIKRFVSSYRPFRSFYGDYYTMSYTDWLRSICNISVPCDCCDNVFFD